MKLSGDSLHSSNGEQSDRVASLPRDDSVEQLYTWISNMKTALATKMMNHPENRKKKLSGPDYVRVQKEILSELYIDGIAEKARISHRAVQSLIISMNNSKGENKKLNFRKKYHEIKGRKKPSSLPTTTKITEKRARKNDAIEILTRENEQSDGFEPRTDEGLSFFDH